jgi:hypothetical protein
MSAQQAQFVTFKDMCPTIDYSFSLIEEEGDYFPKILSITFSGNYRDGSEGNPDARFMTGIVDTAINVWQPKTVLIDISECIYQWGDGIVSLFKERHPVKIAFLLSEKCKPALTNSF